MIDRKLFMKLAHQFFVPIPDPHEELRAAVHAHISAVQRNAYRLVEAEVDRTGRWVHIPTLEEIEERAFSTFTAKGEPVTFKYQDVAKPGDRIRSHDFHEREDCFIEGVVQRVDLEGAEMGFACLVVVVDVDGWRGHKDPVGGRVGQTVYVPLETAFFEWDGRIIKLPEQPPACVSPS